MIKDEVIEYSTPEGPSSFCQNWSLPIRDIKILGEYTNSDGPHLDDYFFVFVLADGSWRQASFYAEGRDDFLTVLSGKLKTKLECGLCHSTDLNSRVLWPEQLIGSKLFTFARAPLTGNSLSRLLQKMSPSFLFEFTDPVRKALIL